MARIGGDVIALQWVDQSAPWFLVPLLALTLLIVLGVAWAERPRDDWEQLARDDRRAGR